MPTNEKYLAVHILEVHFLILGSLNTHIYGWDMHNVADISDIWGGFGFIKMGRKFLQRTQLLLWSGFTGTAFYISTRHLLQLWKKINSSALDIGTRLEAGFTGRHWRSGSMRRSSWWDILQWVISCKIWGDIMLLRCGSGAKLCFDCYPHISIHIIHSFAE